MKIAIEMPSLPSMYEIKNLFRVLGDAFTEHKEFSRAINAEIQELRNQAAQIEDAIVYWSKKDAPNIQKRNLERLEDVQQQIQILIDEQSEFHFTYKTTNISITLNRPTEEKDKNE